LTEVRRSLTASLKDDVTVRYEQVVSGDAADGIERYIAEHQPDVLALCATGRSIFSRLLHKSVIRQVTAHIACPVLIVHE
ncbi:MAG TPA: universal stress protein, partial [Chryseosolibacter sp.]